MLFVRICKLKAKACVFKDQEALHDLGAIYASYELKWICAEERMQRAFRYYSIAAELGHPESQYDLGFMLYEGEGCIGPDRKTAAYWMNQAANAGFEPAISFMREVLPDELSIFVGTGTDRDQSDIAAQIKGMNTRFGRIPDYINGIVTYIITAAKNFAKRG